MGVVYGFANFIILGAYAVTFRFAAYLLTLPVDHILYANFDEVFTVFLAIILGSLAAGQASTALPLATLATTAASRILGVKATQPDDEESEGRSLVSDCTVTILLAPYSLPLSGECSRSCTSVECLVLISSQIRDMCPVRAISSCVSWAVPGTSGAEWSWQVNRLFSVRETVCSSNWDTVSGWHRHCSQLLHTVESMTPYCCSSLAECRTSLVEEAVGPCGSGQCSLQQEHQREHCVWLPW